MTPGAEARTRLSSVGCHQGKAVIINGTHCDCWIGLDEAKFVYTTDGTIYLYDEETGMTTMADLVTRYNAKVPAEKRVKRFLDKATAEKRVREVEGAKRGRKVLECMLAFKQSPEDKVWQAESLRSKIFKNFEGSTVDAERVIKWATADAQGMTEAQARSCINVLVKDKWVVRS